MPEAVQDESKRKRVNWVPIRRDYLKGHKPRWLAKKYAVTAKAIGVACARQKWGSDKEKLSNRVEKTIKSTIDSVSKTLVQQRSTFLNMLQRDALRKVELYTKELPEPDNWREAANSERAISSVSARGRIAFGLDDNKGSNLTVNFGIIPPVQARTDTKQLSESADQPIIDVEQINQDDPGQANPS